MQTDTSTRNYRRYIPPLVFSETVSISDMLDVFFADFAEIETSFDLSNSSALRMTDTLLYSMRDAMQQRITSEEINRDILEAQRSQDQDAMSFHEGRRQAFLPTLRATDGQVEILLKQLREEIELQMPFGPHYKVERWSKDVTQALDMSFEAIRDLSKTA